MYNMFNMFNGYIGLLHMSIIINWLIASNGRNRSVIIRKGYIILLNRYYIQFFDYIAIQLIIIN